MKPHTKHFNMIELIIALVIVVIVLVSLMSLVPGSMRSNQRAVHVIAAADSAELLIGTLKNRIEITPEEVNVFPSEKNLDDDTTMLFSTYSIVPGSNQQISFQVDNEIDQWDPTGEHSGVFKVRHVSNSNQVDFTGIARVWKTVKSIPVSVSTISIAAERGLFGGHFDVDTSSFVAKIGHGTTDGHVHEYDDIYDVQGIDCFDLLDSKLHNIDDDISDTTQMFVLNLVNKGLSTGARISINQAYDPDNPATYSSTVPKTVYSLDGTTSSKPLYSFGIWFHSMAILDGGLVKAETKDVRANDPGPNGEHRAGALTIQALKINEDGSRAYTLGANGAATSGLLWECTLFYHRTEKDNSGHGNNVDGVDSDNKGTSKEGEDTDPTVDDEIKTGGGKGKGDDPDSIKITGEKDGYDMIVTKTVTAQEVTLNCEISWPESVPYEKRFKRYYTLAVYDQGSVTVETTVTPAEEEANKK